MQEQPQEQPQSQDPDAEQVKARLEPLAMPKPEDFRKAARDIILGKRPLSAEDFMGAIKIVQYQQAAHKQVAEQAADASRRAGFLSCFLAALLLEKFGPLRVKKDSMKRVPAEVNFEIDGIEPGDKGNQVTVALAPPKVEIASAMPPPPNGKHPIINRLLGRGGAK